MLKLKIGLAALVASLAVAFAAAPAQAATSAANASAISQVINICYQKFPNTCHIDNVSQGFTIGDKARDGSTCYYYFAAWHGYSGTTRKNYSSTVYASAKGQVGC